MADLVQFIPKAEFNAAQNLRAFIDTCRTELTVFGEDLPFDSNVWDITSSISLKGFGNKKHRLVFSNLETVNDKSPLFMPEPFLSFAKAYFRYMQGYKPVNGTGPRMAALRALEAALREVGKVSPADSDLQIFNRAAQMIVEKYSPAAAYRMGGQLVMLSEFLCEHKLTSVSVRWRNFIKRPNDTVRVGKEFDERRNDKMPTQAALDALPEIFLRATEPVDVIVSSVAALLCASPDRISEVMSLPLDCEFKQLDKKTGVESYGLRWRPAKGADPMIKWVVPSMVGVVQEAIAKIRKITAEARLIAAWYEAHPNEMYLVQECQHLRGRQCLTMQELTNILGFANKGSARAWCKLNAIQRTNDLVNFYDVEGVILSMLPNNFPLIDKVESYKYSEALFVVRTDELGTQRGTNNCMIELININQINSALGGRVKHGFQSVFTRFGYVEPDGSNINVSTHQFRHYLNTLAQAGGLSQLDIAKWSGRKDIKQNSAYDHVTPSQMVAKIRSAIGHESKMFGPLADLSKNTLIPRDEFARLVVPTAHTTELGYCIHDYTMTPCQKHMDCINCTDLICVKGDFEKELNLRKQLDEAIALMEKAEQATKDEYYGSDRWFDHHKETVKRLRELLSIIESPALPKGAVIQIAAPKTSTQAIDVQKRLKKFNGLANGKNKPDSEAF